MKKYGKAGLLIVTLVIPALIFTFLRFFATNHYNIPYYHPEEDSQGMIRLTNSDTLFYAVPDVGGLPLNNGLTVVSYRAEECNDSCQIMRDNLERIYMLRDRIKKLGLVSVADSGTMVQNKEIKAGWQVVEMDAEQRDSIFKWNEPVGTKNIGSPLHRWLLIDEKRHIRGYYNGVDREETDRLMAEIKILSIEEKAH